MPSSSNPFNLVSAALLAAMGVPCTLLGVVGALAETGTMRLVFGMLAVSGLLMIGGAVQAVVAWRRAERRERGHEAALYQAVRRAAPAAEPPQALQERSPSAPSAVAAAPVVPTDVADAEVLAHWTYAPDEWSEYSRRELSFRRGEAKWFAAGVVGLGALLLVFDRDADYAVALGVAGFLGAVFWLGKTLQARAAHAANTATRGGEVIISPRAVMLNGRYHVLQDDRFRFAGVRLLDEEDPPVLEFSVAWQTRSGQVDEQVYVPVPRGREEEARALAASFPRRPATTPP
ncbi:MAG: hypothetical protein AB1941_11935 [Gemmatimonadota bacterium]